MLYLGTRRIRLAALQRSVADRHLRPQLLDLVILWQANRKVSQTQDYVQVAAHHLDMSAHATALRVLPRSGTTAPLLCGEAFA